MPRLGRNRSGNAGAAPDSSTVEALCDFEVVGHHLIDPDRLLVLGDDEHLYALDIQNGQTAPTEFTGQWLIDTCTVPPKSRRTLQS